MDAKAEAKAKASAEKYAAEFRRKHGIPEQEWELAEEMTADLQKGLLARFWEICDRDVPVQPAAGLRPAERRTARHRKRGPRTG